MICGNLCSAVCIDADCNIVNTCYVVICLQPVSKDENLPKCAFKKLQALSFVPLLIRLSTSFEI